MLKKMTALLLASAMPAIAQDSTPEQRNQLNVTLYQNGMALIQDSRTLNLEQGIQNIRFQGVTPQIIADSALLAGTDINVLERNYTYDLISLEALLKASIGQQIGLQLNGRFFGNMAGPYFVNATLVAVQNQRMIIKADVPGENSQKILALPINQYGDLISFDQVPGHLSESPTLSMQVQANTAGESPVTLTYLSNGFDWQASYVSDITSETSINLDAWVTLQNHTNTALNDARVQLLAGEVNRAMPVHQLRNKMMQDAEMVAMAPPPAAQLENVGDYKLFTLPRNINLAAKQKKQVALFNAERVRVEKHYTLPLDLSHSAKRVKARVSLKLSNTPEAGLGTPMPAGIMRFYQQDHGGLRQFVGEVLIPDLDKHETYSANIGKAFGITANNKNLRWDNAGWLQGELELINSQKKSVISELVVQPLHYRVNKEYKRVSLCETPKGKQDAKLKLNFRPVTGGPKLVSVSEEDSGACRISVQLAPDTRSLYRYEYRIPKK